MATTQAEGRLKIRALLPEISARLLEASSRRVRAASRADAKGNITAKSDNVRQVLDYARRLAPFLPPDVYSSSPWQSYRRLMPKLMLIPAGGG
jgi:hypothetical protein